MPLRLAQVVVDCRDATALAAFWSALLDRPVAEGADVYHAVVPTAGPGDVPTLMFLQVPEPAVAKNRLHLDFETSDREETVGRVVDLGGRRLADLDEWGTRWTTCADPEGNVFDVSSSPH